MAFSSDADEVFYHLLALDQKSDILSHLPMAAYAVRADGVVVWYNTRLNCGAAGQSRAIRMNAFVVLTRSTTPRLWSRNLPGAPA